ncbi:hypothetical protein ACIQRS_08040 [Streptomyces termitum]|uniref:Uncharacterized protein n=1 Tax=Streptomyces termitum TaxID=67368 RepID=A0A918SPZ2_9ACTN|nr:hypothetical protein [Streptomyces termitum]GHA65191.1 hypothetical protein GCM10010305_03530 [Streptomyces termitum]
MGRREWERKVARRLERAGVELRPGGVPEGAVPHVFGAERERHAGGFQLDYGTPRLVERLNESWYELASSIGLFDGDGEFLLMLPRTARTAEQHRRRHDMPVWRRVRLRERWDLMGTGAAGFLGTRAGHPGFAALALDGGVWILVDTYETGVGAYAVRDPARSPGVLRQLEREVRAGRGRDRDFLRETAAWLERRN